MDAHVLDWTVAVKGINQLVPQQAFTSAKWLNLMFPLLLDHSLPRYSDLDLAHCAATAETGSSRTSCPVSTDFHFSELSSIAARFC